MDVLVRSKQAGVNQLWVVECKQWKRRVGKDRVLVLSEILKDVGADRGLLLSESGFQAGAIRAASTANITLTNLLDLRGNAAEELAQLHARVVLARLHAVRRRLMDLGRTERHGRGGKTTWPRGIDPLPVLGRCGITISGIDDALVGELPSVIDINLGTDKPVTAHTLGEAAALGELVAAWAEPIVEDAERRL